MDRFQGLKDFVVKNSASGDESGELELISGDASFRKYYRQGNFIYVDAPATTEKNREFVAYSAKLRSCGIHAPEVMAYDFDQGYLKIENFGNRQFASVAVGAEQVVWYSRAIDVLGKLADLSCSDLEIYDSAFINRELTIFTDWYVGKYLSASFSSAQNTLWRKLSQLLVTNDLEQKQIAMHRDYHCRNIMILEDGLGILDFQDMVQGPLTYDLVSLLKDCYVTLDDELRNRLLHQGYEIYRSKNLLDDESFEKFQRHFDLTGLQRHLKAAGIFSRLKYRDGRDQYLQYLPRTLGYVRETIEEYPELNSFRQLLEDLIK